MASGELFPEDHSSDHEVCALPEKLERLIGLANLGPDDFYTDFCASQEVKDVRTPRAWHRGTSIPHIDNAPGKKPAVHSHIPGKTNQGKIASYFKKKLGLSEFTVKLLHCDLAEFDEKITALFNSRVETRLEVPVAHRLGTINDRYQKGLIGKYQLYRHSLRDNGLIVSEIFTLSPADQKNYLDIQLFSYAVHSEELERFLGRFFLYGKLFSAILTFTDPEALDHMRILSFPQLNVLEGVYSGFMTSHLDERNEVVTVRTVAIRYSEETEYDDADRLRTVTLKPDAEELVDILPLLTNRVGDESLVLSTLNRPGPLTKLRRI